MSTTLNCQETYYDAGRELMSYTMKVKLEQMAYRAECRQTEECPELMDRESEGAAECVDGK